MCGSRKYPYPIMEGTGNSRGEGGGSKTQEIPKGRGLDDRFSFQLSFHLNNMDSSIDLAVQKSFVTYYNVHVSRSFILVFKTHYIRNTFSFFKKHFGIEQMQRMEMAAITCYQSTCTCTCTCIVDQKALVTSLVCLICISQVAVDFFYEN